MPVYEYAHEGDGCTLGREFEHTQSIKDDALKACPQCGAPVRRLISRPYISTPQGDSALKNMGFTKLVKRDNGVYENVTRGKDESRYMVAGQADTVPKFQNKITD